MIFLLEQNWHMIIILNGMVVLRFTVSVGQPIALNFLVRSLEAFRRILTIGKMMMTDSPLRKSHFMTAEDEPTSNLLTIDMVYTDAMNGDAQNAILQKNAMISQTPSGNNHVQSVPNLKKKTKSLRKGRPKNLTPKEVDVKAIARMLSVKEAQNDILICEKMKIDASSNLESLYNEIRPAIEEHERDRQDNVPTSVAEKWIEASCSKMKAEFDLYFSIIKNVVCTPKRKLSEIEHPPENEVKLLADS